MTPTTEQKIFKSTDGVYAKPGAAQTTDEKTADGFQNFAAKIGVGPRVGNGAETNLISQGQYYPNYVTRNRLQLEWAYRGSWIVGRVIDSRAKDMTRAGITITTNEQAETVPDFMKYMTRMSILRAFKETIQWGNLYGGAVGVYQIDGQKLDQPLKIDAVGKDQFKGITVYDRWQIWPVLSKLIDSGPDMGLPMYYDIVSGTDINDAGKAPDGGRANPETGSVRVHYTRLFRAGGIKLPFFQAITEMLWGESVLERMWDRLIAFDDASLSAGSLINRANLRTIKFEGLREIMAAGGKAMEGLTAQVEWMRQMQTNEGITAMDKEDEFESTSYSFAGIPDTLMQFAQQVSGAAETPLVILFCQTPSGLNSTGDADIRNYYDRILADQEDHLRNPMDDVLKIMWRSFTGQASPSDLTFKFVPLWQMTAVDKATVAKTNTETLSAAAQEGAIDRATYMKELRQSSAETGLFTHITDEAIEEAEHDEPPQPDMDDPDDEADSEGADKPPKKKDKADKSKPVGDSAIAKFARWFTPKRAEEVRRTGRVRVAVTDHQRIKDWLAKQK